MRRTAWWTLSGVVLLAAGGCWQDSAGLQDIQVRVEVSPDRVDFGRLRAGTLGQRSLTVHNRSAGPARVDAVELLGDTVFSRDGAGRLTIPAGDARTLSVTVMGNSPGQFTGTLRIHCNSQQAPQQDVPLSVTLDPPEDCEDHNPCTLDRWETDGCVHLPVSGPCDDSNACTTADHCEDGRCVGDALPCVDSVDCTVDACDPQRGCTHTPLAARCADGDPCTRDTCDPVAGCRWESGDGDSCGVRDGCVAMPVCWAGQCVPVPVPDGLTCDDGDPDTSQDSCRQGHCAGTRSQLLSSWPAGPASAITADADGVYWTSAPDTQGRRALLHVSGAGMPLQVLATDVDADVLKTDLENVYWVDHRHGVVGAVSKDGEPRWRVPAPGCEPLMALGGWVYWVRGTEVWRTSRVHGFSELMVRTPGRIAGLAVDELDVYVTDRDANTVMRWGRDAWAQPVPAAGQVGAIVADGDRVSWLEDGKVAAAMPSGGGDVLRRAGLGSGYTHVLSDGSNIYLANPVDAVDRLNWDGRGENLLASVRAVTPRVYALFDGFLYYVDNGVVLREPVTGGVEVLARAVPNFTFPLVRGDSTYRAPREGIQRFSRATRMDEEPRALPAGPPTVFSEEDLGTLTQDGWQSYWMNERCHLVRETDRGDVLEDMLWFTPVALPPGSWKCAYPDATGYMFKWMVQDAWGGTVLQAPKDGRHPREVAGLPTGSAAWTAEGLLAQSGGGQLSWLPRSTVPPERVAASGEAPVALMAWHDGAAWVEAPLDGLASLHVAHTQGSQVAVVAQDLGHPASLTWADGVLYWADPRDGTLMSVPDDGGPVPTLARAQPNADHLTVTDGILHWSVHQDDRFQLRAMPVGGGPIAVTAEFDGPLHRVEVAGGRVLVLLNSTLWNALDRAQFIATGVDDFTADRDAIYFVYLQRVWRHPFHGGPEQVVSDAGVATGSPFLQVEDRLAWVTRQGDLVMVPKNATEQDAPEILHHFPTLPWALGFTDAQVWWAAPGEVGWFPR